MRYKIIPGAVLMALFASNAYALGDSIHICELQVHPCVTATVWHDDNITRSEGKRQSSAKITVNPALDITTGSGINQVEFHYDFDRGNYVSSSTDSYSGHHVSGATHNELTSKAMVDTTVSFNKSHDPRGSTFYGIVTDSNTSDRWHKMAATAKFSYGRGQATGRIVFDGMFIAVITDVT